MNETSEYFQLAKNQIEQQRQNMDTLNAKVNTLLIVCGVLIVFIGEIASRGNSILGGFLLGSGILLILPAIIILLIAYRVVDWKQGPNIDRIFFDVEHNTKIEIFYKDATEAMKEWYTENENVEITKSRRINRAGRLMMWGVFINVIGIVLYFIFLF